MKKLLLILYLFMITSCIGTPPTPEDSNKKSTPRCCVGQDKHTCGMAGMPNKPEPTKK